MSIVSEVESKFTSTYQQAMDFAVPVSIGLVSFFLLVGVFNWLMWK